MFSINLLDLNYSVCHLYSLHHFSFEMLSVPQNPLQNTLSSDSSALLQTYRNRIFGMAFLEASQIIVAHGILKTIFYILTSFLSTDLSVADRWVVSYCYYISIFVSVFLMFCFMNFDTRSFGTWRSMRTLHVYWAFYCYKVSLLK